jgi:hypothetical protein
MKAQLKEKGYADYRIREMRPEVAWKILNPPKKNDDSEMDRLKSEIKDARKMERKQKSQVDI